METNLLNPDAGVQSSASQAAPVKKPVDSMDVVASVFLGVFGVGLGLVAAFIIGLATGWIPFNC